VDDSDDAREAAALAARLAAALGLELVLVHAYAAARLSAAIPATGMTPPIDHEDLIRRQHKRGYELLEGVARTAERECSVHMRVDSTDPVPALERCASDTDAELIVVGTRGYGAAVSAVLGSTSSGLAASGPAPVIVVPTGAGPGTRQALAAMEGGNAVATSNYAKKMLETHPRPGHVDRGLLANWIEECFTCAQACTACADACLSEDGVAELRKCIRLNLDCADICDATGRVLTRQTQYDAPTSKAQLQSCREACRTCGEECERHAERHQHCGICAEACSKCERACMQLLDAMK
jgi:nucleotide-binding universal stress UspA family protein